MKRNRINIFSKITVIFLILFVITGGLVTPRKAEAVIPVTDGGSIMATLQGWAFDGLWWAEEKADKIIDAIKEKWAWTTYRTILSNALSKMAYEYATYLGNGSEGQKPMFLTEDRGTYFTNMADNAAGTFIEQISQGAFGEDFNLCEPDFSAKVLIGLGLTPPKLASNDCTFTGMMDNWDKEISENKEFLSDFQNYFSTGGDLGLTVSMNDEKLAAIEAAKNKATLDLIISKGYREIEEPISGKKTAPPGEVEKEEGMVRQALNSNLVKSTGNAFVDAGKVFANQYFITLFNRKMRELGRDLPNTSQPYSGDYGGLVQPDSEELTNNSSGTASLNELLIPNFETSTDLDVLTDLTTCPDASSAGVNECVITQNFATAINNNLTVGQAMEDGYLRQDGRFGFVVQSIDGVYGCYGEEPAYDSGYPYRSMLILRKYRVLPVGWELAAQYIHDNPSDTRNCNLGDMVACYDMFDDYEYQSETCLQGSWCRNLVDPNWVLTIPQHTCRREGPGPKIVSYQNVSSGGIDSKLIVQREDYCADEQSCIYEKLDGVCEQYGYCVEEKRKWNFGTEECDSNFNSCETFRNEAGGAVSYMENTLDNGTCTSDNVGCLSYCEDYSLDTSDVPIFTLEQDGKTYSLPVTFATAETAASFYNYTASSFNQPDLYPLLKQDKSVMFMHYDTDNAVFSLGIMHDYPNEILYNSCETLSNCSSLSLDCDCDGGSVNFTFDYISAGNSVAVQDDPGEGFVAGTELSTGDTWGWNWGSPGTDGAMIDMPADNWSVTINPNSSFTGVNRWVMAYDGGEVNLDLSLPITISKNVMSGNFECLAGNGDTLYLDQDAEECDEESEGCQELIRTKTGLGTNLIQNSSFEDNTIGDTVNVPIGAYDIIGNTDIAWSVYGWTSGADVSVYGSSAGKVHSGSKSLLIESDDAGLYSKTLDVTSSVFPDNFEMEINKAYTLSAWVWVESGEVQIAIGNDTTSWKEVNSTTTGSWERLVATIVNEPGISADEILIYGNAVGSKFWVDDIQLEAGLEATAYKGYRDSNVVYEKLLPSYLEDECYRIPGTDYKFKDDRSSVCDDYARLCNKDEVGCELYTSINTGLSIPANVDVLDYCTAECVGYDEYLQLESPFSSLSPKYFIPADADSCDAGSVGCEEFTNLDAVGGGGEDREYYSYLRQCVKPTDTGTDCREFYTWEGSSETGFQLKVHNLNADDDTDDGSLTPEARYIGDPAVTSYDYDECNSLIYQLNLNSDCREFYNRSGQVSYHLYSRTLTCSEDCHPFRMTKNNIAKDPVTGANISWGTCQGLSNFSDYRDIITNAEFIARGGECVFCINGGVWNEDMDACVYKAIPSEGTACSVAVSGCREYSGSDGNLIFNVLTDDFEGDVQDWVGIGATTIITDNDALRINEEALRVQNAPFTIAKEVGTEVTQGKSYYLEFIAKNISASQFNSIYLTNGTDVAEFKTNPSMTLSIGGDYALYKLNLSVLGHEVSDVESLVIEADGGFLIDDIKLTEIKDRYYEIEDSGDTPDSCFEDVYGNPTGQLTNLGCDAYQDRAGDTHYLHNFPVLCQESAVGCEAMIDTHDYDLYYDYTFNSGDVSEEVVAGDAMVYAVYDDEKECDAEEKGCQLLGEPYDYGNFSLYRETYLINDPNVYTSILCQGDDEGCQEWESQDGTSYFKDPGDQTCEYRLESNSGQLGGACISNTDCEYGYECLDSVCTKKIREWNWYKTQVKRCDSDSNGEVGVVDNICLDASDCGSSGLTCLTDQDCGNDYDVCLAGECHYACVEDQGDYLCPTTSQATIGTGGEGSTVYTPTVDSNYNTWVGICPSNQASCTEYIDPISNFSVNLLGNGGFSNLYSYSPAWYCSIGGAACDLSISGMECDNSNAATNDDGVCVDNVWKFSGSTYTQAVSLEENKMYRLAGKNDNPGSQLTIECPLFNIFDATSNKFTTSVNSSTIDLTDAGVMYSELFSVQNQMDCIVTMDNVDVGASDYVELKEVLVEYQLEDGLDKETCNGIVNPDEGCVLFNERNVESKSLSGITYSSLPYSADVTSIGAPVNCLGVNCSANQLLKVEPDRACNKWLACTNMIEAGNGEEAVCESIGICDKLDKNGDCARFVAKATENYVYHESLGGVYNAGDIHNMSGDVKVGYENTKINENTTGKSDDKLNFGSMIPYGGQASISNPSFEFAVENICTAATTTDEFCPEGTDWPQSDVDPTIKASEDYGDPDYPISWDCTASRLTNCEVIDDAVENEAEGDCFEEDRDGTCKIYAPHGSQYMKLTSDNEGIATLTSSEFSVDPDTDYILSFYVSTKALNNGKARITILENDGDGNLINSWDEIANYRLPWHRVMKKFKTDSNVDTLNIAVTEINLPQGDVYIDDFRLEQTLQVREGAGDLEDIYEGKECRLYPETDSLACDYYKDGMRYKGWSGYCLEHDRYPGWDNACLQWWSIPHSVDSVNTWCGDEIVADEEDCECDRDGNGDEVYNCDSRSTLFGTARDNSYNCSNCLWAGGWCGDNYVDLTQHQGRAEECDWNDSLGVSPWGSEPLKGGITCENLPSAWDWASRSDLAGYAGSMFTDGNLGCFSHDGGANYTLDNDDRCYFDTSYTVGAYNVGDPTSDPVSFGTNYVGFGCTSDLYDDDTSSATNLVHTAQQCIAAGGEVVSEIITQPSPNQAYNGAVVIDSSGDTVVFDADFGNTFCKFSGQTYQKAGTHEFQSIDYDEACNQAATGWKAYYTNGSPWTATQKSQTHVGCDSGCDDSSWNGWSDEHDIFQNIEAEHLSHHVPDCDNENGTLTSTSCTGRTRTSYTIIEEIGCY